MNVFQFDKSLNQNKMKPIKLILAYIITVLLSAGNSMSQVPYEASIGNNSVSGDTVFFDIFFRATDPAQPLYFGDADIVFFFNDSNFTAETFGYVEESTYFINSNGTRTHAYDYNIATDTLSQNVIVVNVSGLAFSTQNQFNSRVAKIDTTHNLHKLGRFYVTGITNPSGNLDLEWKTSPPGVSTIIMSYIPTDPWYEYMASGTLIEPPVIPLHPFRDVAVTSFSSPVNGQILDRNGSDVTVYLKNLGDESVNNIDVYMQFDSLPPVGPVTVVQALSPGDSVSVIFNGANQLSSNEDAIGNLTVYSQILNDDDSLNNGTTVSVVLTDPVTSFPFFESWRTPALWTTSGTASLWSTHIATDPSGAPSDTSLKSAFFGNNGTQLLRSPLIDLTGMTNPVLSFYVAYTTKSTSPGNDMVQVLISTNGGISYNPAIFDKGWTSIPSLGTVPSQDPEFIPGAANHWRHEIVNLTPYAGEKIVVSFSAISGVGNNAWIDNVKITDADHLSFISVNAAGTYGNLESDGAKINFTALRPGLGGNTISQPDALLETITFPMINVTPLTYYKEQRRGTPINKNHGKRDGNFGISPDASEGVLVLSRVDENPINNTFATNLTSTTFSGAIFTPDVVANRYWEIAFTGNDYVSTATYDVIIDISTQLGIVDPDRLYILKRADQNADWVCVSTITEYELGLPVRLIASGLQGFSQFTIGSEDGTLPVSIVEFTAVPEKNNVKLNWKTEWEAGNDRFEIQRKLTGSKDWSAIGNIPGAGNVTTPRNYTFTDKGLAVGVYDYRLICYDTDGNVSDDNMPVINVEIGAPEVFALLQNYPNPFNPVTQIDFQVPVEGMVKLNVFDIAGREVSTIVNENLAPGYYTYSFDASSLSTGAYFYRLVTKNTVLTKRMLLVK